MKLMQIGRLTEKGESAVRALLSETARVENPSERVARAAEIIADPELCVPVKGAGYIDLSKRFRSALEFAEHVHEAIAPLGNAAIRDRGINLFLYCAYIDQLIKPKARVIDSYFLDEKTKGGDLSIIRNYRNAVFVHLSFYRLHRDAPAICRTLLSGAPNELSNAMEKIAQNNEIMGSKAAMELVIAMFFDAAKGGYRRAPKPKSKRVKSKNAGKALQELSSILFRQCSANYDVSRMTAPQLLKLVPGTNGLAGWKRYGEESLAEGAAEETVPADAARHDVPSSPSRKSHGEVLARLLGGHFGKAFVQGRLPTEILSADGTIKVKAAYANVNPLKGEDSVHADVPGNALEHDYFAFVRVKDGQVWLVPADELEAILLAHKNEAKPRHDGERRWNVLIRTDAAGDWIDRDRKVSLRRYRIQSGQLAAA